MGTADQSRDPLLSPVRLPWRLGEPQFTDRVTQFQRRAVVHIEQVLHDEGAAGTNRLGLILDTVQRGSDYFLLQDVRRILNAANESDKALERAVDSLLKKDGDFREKFGQLGGR